MKNTLGRVTDAGFFLASTTAIVGAPSMTQFHRGMGGMPAQAETADAEKPPTLAIQRLRRRMIAAN